jgi:hypothetical protein
MFFNTSSGKFPDETSESNIEKGVDCSILSKTSELLTSKCKKANSLPVN